MDYITFGNNVLVLENGCPVMGMTVEDNDGGQKKALELAQCQDGRGKRTDRFLIFQKTNPISARTM